MVRVMPSFQNEYHNSRLSDRGLFKSISYTCNSSYQKLPRQLIKLSVLKLNGSSFDVWVHRNATVAQLRLAVESVFSSPPKEGEANNISWSRVWGYFCLCHEDHKLLDDKAQIQNLGINDGDELKFIQHMSVNYSPTKQRPKRTGSISRHFSMPSLLKCACAKGNQTSIDDDEPNFSPLVYGNEEEIEEPKFKFNFSLNSRFAYAKLTKSTRKRYSDRDLSLKF